MAITGHLHQHRNLISEMKSKCPRFIDTRWLSMQRLLQLLISKRPCLQQHFEEKNPFCAAQKNFWIIVYVLKAFVDTINKSLVAIQKLSTLLNCQKMRLEKLVNEFMKDCGVEGPSIFQHDNDSVVSGSYHVLYENDELFMKDQDMFIVDLLQVL